jgi:hypothetical protein
MSISSKTGDKDGGAANEEDDVYVDIVEAWKWKHDNVGKADDDVHVYIVSAADDIYVNAFCGASISGAGEAAR